MTAAALIRSDGTELIYDTVGDPADRLLLLIAGLVGPARELDGAVLAGGSPTRPPRGPARQPRCRCVDQVSQ